MSPFINTLLPVLVALSLGLAAFANPSGTIHRDRAQTSSATAAAAEPQTRPLFVESFTVVAPRRGTSR
jgi:hypothetical protein